MSNERRMLLAAIAIAVAGWLTAGALATAVGIYKLRADSSEDEMKKWKRQAGKAYTELITARHGDKGAAAIIPAGSRIECTMSVGVINGKAISKCEADIYYPPRDY